MGILQYMKGDLSALSVDWHVLGNFAKNIFSNMFSITWTLIIIFIALAIFFENRNPASTAAWLIVLVFIPLLGFILYIFFGTDIRKQKVFRKISAREPYTDNRAGIEEKIHAVEREKVFSGEDSDMGQKVSSLLLRNSTYPFTANNHSEIFASGILTFKQMMQDMEEAKDHIHLEFFIIKDDSLSNRIKDILIKKAKEGVKVRVIYDGFGARYIKGRYIRELTHAGVEVKPFLPIIFPFLNRYSNYRNHRKIVVIDGKIGYTGGVNIADEYLGHHPRFGVWRDTHMKIEGEGVYILQDIFLRDWYFVSDEKVMEEDRYFPVLAYYGDEIVQIAPSGPDSDWESILQAYFMIIAMAKKRIHIITPYLIPSESIKDALITSALAGVDVKIIVPGIPDKKFVYWATESNFEELLKAGIRIYRYSPGFIHSKIFVTDSGVASIGTANLDLRSLQQNFEVNAFYYDKEVVEKLEEIFQDDLKYSEEVLLKDFLDRNAMDRLKQSTARLFSPLL